MHALRSKPILSLAGSESETSPARRGLIFKALHEVDLALQVLAPAVSAEDVISAAGISATAPLRTHAAAEAAMLELLVSTLMPSHVSSLVCQPECRIATSSI